VTYRGLVLNELLFTGADVHAAGLVLKPGLNVLYGASNAGKSFTVKAIDFLLGSSRPLPEIAERKAFDKAWLAIQTPVSGNVPLMRALAGGALELHGGHVDLSSERKTNGRHLSARHDHTNGENVSQFLLKKLGFGSRFMQLMSMERSAVLAFEIYLGSALPMKQLFRPNFRPPSQDNIRLLRPSVAFSSSLFGKIPDDAA
jgi:hypothetical protein